MVVLDGYLMQRPHPRHATAMRSASCAGIRRPRLRDGQLIGWLTLIRDRILVDAEVRLEDFDEMPFVERGGRGKVWSLFGEALEGIVDELNRELVA